MYTPRMNEKNGFVYSKPRKDICQLYKMVRVTTKGSRFPDVFLGWLCHFSGISCCPIRRASYELFIQLREHLDDLVMSNIAWWLSPLLSLSPWFIFRISCLTLLDKFYNPTMEGYKTSGLLILSAALPHPTKVSWQFQEINDFCWALK